MFPNKIQILHKIYDVNIEPIEKMPKDTWGTIAHRERIIKISSDLCDQEKILVLLHEIVHAMLDINGRQQNEGLCEAFSNLLFNIIRDNPILIKSIQVSK